jgi:hypothetical protein
MSSTIETEQECHSSYFGQHEVMIIVGFIDLGKVC